MNYLRLPLVRRHLLAWGLALIGGAGGAADVASGDLLQLADGSPPVAGRLLEENAHEVNFQVWDVAGRQTPTTYPATAVLRVIRTIDPATLEKLPSLPPSETLVVAETLLAITEDAAATASGLGLLRDMLARDDLEPALRQAVERLQVNALRPGLARARWQQAMARSTQQLTLPEAHDVDDPWVWYLTRLDETTQVAWRQAMQQDRHPASGAASNPTTNMAAIPREQLLQAILRTEQAWPAHAPRTAWCGELRAALAADDYSALVTILRLELLLQTTPPAATPSAIERQP